MTARLSASVFVTNASDVTVSLHGSADNRIRVIRLGDPGGGCTIFIESPEALTALGRALIEVQADMDKELDEE